MSKSSIRRKRTQLHTHGTHDLAIRTRSPISQRHTAEVLALALSTDGRYLVSGGRDKAVRLWDARTNKYAIRIEHMLSASAQVGPPTVGPAITTR